MRYLHFLRDIKAPPAPIHLVDIALFLSILPHLGNLRFPMLVFLLLSFIVLVMQKEVNKGMQRFLTLFGLISVIVSFYSDFNFSDFGKFSLYLSLLNAVLMYAVILQRLKGELNFYLTFSPALLLVLSFFLHNSIGMLFYMVFVLFIFLMLLIWCKMYTPLYDAIKLSLSIFVYSLPVVAVLFMVFPRISFEKADYGFRDTLEKRSGHDGTMSLGSDALLVPSTAVVMEVSFDTKPPANKELYFRGSVLYVDTNSSFTQLPLQSKKLLHVKQRAENLRQKVSYKVTLYPNYMNWVYVLDIPTTNPSKTKFLEDYTIISDKAIKEVYRYEMDSYLAYDMNAPLDEKIEQASLQINSNRDKQSVQEAKELIGSSDIQTLQNLMEYFTSLELTYTLKPDKFDKTKPIDSFLFGTKRGYCVHFSAAFTYMARAANLPTRVVTGYLINSSEMYENYLVVRENAAHAWVEVYLKDKGWVRVETTSFAKYIDKGSLENIQGERLSQTERFFKQANLQVMYVKYVIETWILEYSRVKQMQILDDLLHDTAYLLKFVLILLLFIGVSIFSAIFIQVSRSKDKVLLALKPLLKDAKKKGFEKKDTQSMHDFLMSLKGVYLASTIDEVDSLYHVLRYSTKTKQENIVLLKKSIKHTIR